MRTLGPPVAFVVVALLSACGGGDDDPVAQSADSSPPPAEESSSATRPAPKRSEQQPSAVMPSQRDNEPQLLIGTVGDAEDPEAFTISLTDGSGKPVKSIEPGEYLVRVTDPAQYHNFHLTGPGVNERTSVFGTSKVQWEVTLKSGEYSFVCDPHPQMTGNVVVTDGA